MKNYIDYIDKFHEVPTEAGYTTAGWYFWDETLTQCLGPFATRDEAVAAFSEYCEQLERSEVKE